MKKNAMNRGARLALRITLGDAMRYAMQRSGSDMLAHNSEMQLKSL
jgi:hypothetical protein